MHIIKQYETSVSMFSLDGEVSTYPSMRAALRELGYNWIIQNVLQEFWMYAYSEQKCNVDGNVHEVIRCYYKANFIMRNDAGEPLTAVDFQPLVQRRRTHYRNRPMEVFWNGLGPVPGIHRWRKRRYYRRPQTTNERRFSIPLFEEGEVSPRPARNYSNLPTRWDDILITARRDRSWKRNRKNQWRG